MFLNFLFLLILLGQEIQAQSASFTLSVPKVFPGEVTTDIIRLMTTSTQEKWQIVATENEVRTGIILKIVNNSSFTTKESFHLQTDGNKILIISSNKGNLSSHTDASQISPVARMSINVLGR